MKGNKGSRKPSSPSPAPAFSWKRCSGAPGGATPHDVFVDAVSDALDNRPASSFGASQILARMLADRRGVDLGGLDSRKVGEHLLRWRNSVTTVERPEVAAALAAAGGAASAAALAAASPAASPAAAAAAAEASRRESDLAHRAAEAMPQRVAPGRTSRYKGVRFERSTGKWTGRVATLASAREHANAAAGDSPVLRTDFYLGSFDSEEAAAHAYDVELIRTRGPAAARGAGLNFDLATYLDGAGRWRVQPPPPRKAAAAAAAALAASMMAGLDEGAEGDEEAENA